MGRVRPGPGGQHSSCSAVRNPGQHEGPVCCDRGRGAMARASSGRWGHLMRSRLLYFAAVQPAPAVRISLLTCGARGTRTPDPLLAKQVLFQLSYSPELRRSKGTCGRGALVDAPDGAQVGGGMVGA